MPNAEERSHNPSPFIREEARKLGESSRREQGLDPHITDPVVLSKVGAALTAPLNQAERAELESEENRLKDRQKGER